MIESISFSRYRIFAEPQTLRLAPLTVVFGKNNVGKSALLKLPLLIKSIFNRKSGELFEKYSAGIRLFEDYLDVVYGKANRGVELSCVSKDAEFKLTFSIEQPGSGLRTNLENFNCHRADGSVCANISEVSDLMDFDVEYLKSIRDIPKEGFFTLDAVDSEALAGGLSAYRRLVTDVKDGHGDLLQRVSDWYEENFDGWRLDTDLTRDPVYSLHLKHGIIDSNIVDAGAGIAQSLPVIVSAAADVKRPTLCVYEEPETHLHPEAHGDMAEFIADMAEKFSPNKRFLIETHSVNFLLRLRTLVAQDKLQAENLALYYIEFDEHKDRSYLKAVKVNPDGSVEGWPENVFKETLEESLALHRAQINREGGEK